MLLMTEKTLSAVALECGKYNNVCMKLERFENIKLLSIFLREPILLQKTSGVAVISGLTSGVLRN